MCKHDYIEEVASHFPAPSDSQLGPTLAQIIFQMLYSEEWQAGMVGGLEEGDEEEEGTDGKREEQL